MIRTIRKTIAPKEVTCAELSAKTVGRTANTISAKTTSITAAAR